MGCILSPKLLNMCINGLKKEWKHHWIKVTQNWRPVDDVRDECWVNSMVFVPGDSERREKKIEEKININDFLKLLFHRICILKR